VNFDLEFDLLYSAFSDSTWSRHSAALNCIKKFHLNNNIKIVWPIESTIINSFCHWALTSERLSPATVKAYLTSIQSIHKLKGFENVTLPNYICKTLLKAAENSNPVKQPKFTRAAMTLPTLKLLGSNIAKQNWSDQTKQVIWCACTTAFFGSFRMGELLSKWEHKFELKNTLLWEDVKRFQNMFIIHIKNPKSGNSGGEFADIFPFPGHNCCPVKALECLASFSNNTSPKQPVFMFNNGKLLTKDSFNSLIKNLLSQTMGNNAKFFYGHSFRAGIPSLLAKSPGLATNKDILGWGRWSSDAYLSYTRLKFEHKMKTFDKIASVLNQNKQ